MEKEGGGKVTEASRLYLLKIWGGRLEIWMMFGKHVSGKWVVLGCLFLFCCLTISWIIVFTHQILVTAKTTFSKANFSDGSKDR